ncbi:MAG: NAD(P)-dependent oxidoreductase [Gaiellaceae bacterium]
MSDSSLARIGWIGTGVMGSAMCGHLIDAGYSAVVFNRTRERADSLIGKGAKWRDSPGAVAADADVVVTIVGTPEAVEEVMLGDAGVLPNSRPGTLVVEMTTSEPSLARELFAAGEDRGVDVLDAPVSGGDVGAREARLVVMVGGKPEAFDRALPLLEVFSRLVVHEGGPGAGQHTKMVNQIAIASGLIGVCEALVYATRAGLDVERVIETISGGAAGSWSLTNYAPRMLRGDFEPGFRVDHLVKDLGIALAEARRLKLALPGLALAQQLYVSLQAAGRGDRGVKALVLALAELSVVEWPPVSENGAA